MAYRSTLEARRARKAIRAIKAFDLIEEGDRIMVGLLCVTTACNFALACD